MVLALCCAWVMLAIGVVCFVVVEEFICLWRCVVWRRHVVIVNCVVLFGESPSLAVVLKSFFCFWFRIRTRTMSVGFSLTNADDFKEQCRIHSYLSLFWWFLLAGFVSMLVASWCCEELLCFSCDPEECHRSSRSICMEINLMSNRSVFQTWLFWIFSRTASGNFGHFESTLGCFPGKHPNVKF